MNPQVNWENLSNLGKLRAVIDPNDGMGFKNMLIDRVHWLAIKRHIRGSRNLLDFGCGSGRFAGRITGLGIEYTGIDSSNGMITAARDWNKGEEKRFSHFDGSRIPFADGTFDTILCVRVLLHLLKTPAGEAVLREMARVLVPGGRLIILEEASLSSKKSGQAPCVLTERDYSDALSAQFEVKETHKVRSSEFSRFSRRITEYPVMPYIVFRIILEPLARLELKRAMRFTDEYYKKVTYFDFIIQANVRN